MSGITKREPPISWRPSKEAREKLARLVSETKLSRNDLLNQAIMQHGVLAKIKPDLDKAVALAVENDARLKELKQTVRTVGIDREKILAFQNKTGMDKAPKRG